MGSKLSKSTLYAMNSSVWHYGELLISVRFFRITQSSVSAQMRSTTSENALLVQIPLVQYCANAQHHICALKFHYHALPTFQI